MSIYSQKVNTSTVRDFTTRRQAKKSHLADALASLFNDSALRVTYFDQMTHDDAVEVLMSSTVETKATKFPNFLNYYGCKVADPNTIALYEGCDERCVVRACKYCSELMTDGLLCLTRGEVMKARNELDIDLDYAKLDAVTYLLPPRAIAKLAFVLPATVVVRAVVLGCDQSFEAVKASEITLPDNDIINGSRLSPKR